VLGFVHGIACADGLYGVSLRAFFGDRQPRERRTAVNRAVVAPDQRSGITVYCPVATMLLALLWQVCIADEDLYI